MRGEEGGIEGWGGHRGGMERGEVGKENGKGREEKRQIQLSTR